jgi:ADP-ribosylglycohydrolase
MTLNASRALVLASFLGDSLSLGAHWIYNTTEIAESIGRVDRLLPPPPGSFHAGKGAGEFTHYGDQTLLLLRVLATSKGFDLQAFSRAWQDFLASYQGYFDGATKNTLAGYQKGLGPEEAGSSSNDLAGAGRIAPLVSLLQDKEDELVAAVRAQTHMTHRDPVVVDSAEFFARATLMVLQGDAPVSALEKAAGRGYEHLPARDWLDKGLQSADQETVPAIAGFGKTCHVPHAFPGTVQIIARHEKDFKEGLIQNVMAGGDSAARGLLAGMVLGAHHGLEAIPSDWLDSLKARQEIETLLNELPGPGA